MGFQGEVIADDSGKWATNSLVFPTEAEALDYVKDLARRWTLVREIRVAEVAEEPNYKWVEGRPERIQT